MAAFADKIQQDADFFSSMFHLVPSAYAHPTEQQDTNNKYTHSKTSASARQSIKENSKKGLRQKAKFDPANYTSILNKAKPQQPQPDDDDDDSDEEMDDNDDDDEDDAMSDDDDSPAPKSKKGAPSAKSAAPHSNGVAKPASATTVSASATTVSPPILYAGAPLTNLPPVPTALPADVGMDQLRQRLHERINGLTQKRKPLDHPFAKKRTKKDKDEKKKREKNTDKPTQHKTKTQKTHARDDADADVEQSSAKKQKSSSAVTITGSAPSSSTGVRASDLLETNDFEFGAVKDLKDPQTKSGSYSLAGKQQRKKNKSDAILLKEVESFESRVKDLKASGATEEAAALEQDRSLTNALLRTQGVKVKDDARLLKKSLKRAEKAKEKSRAEWAERTAAQKTTQDAFHKEKIASAMKKQNKDRSKRGSTAADEAAAPKEKPGRGGGPAAAGGRAGFEGKQGKKFLN